MWSKSKAGGTDREMIDGGLEKVNTQNSVLFNTVCTLLSELHLFVIQSDLR